MHIQVFPNPICFSPLFPSTDMQPGHVEEELVAQAGIGVAHEDGMGESSIWGFT